MAPANGDDGGRSTTPGPAADYDDPDAKLHSLLAAAVVRLVAFCAFGSNLN